MGSTRRYHLSHYDFEFRKASESAPSGSAASMSADAAADADITTVRQCVASVLCNGPPKRAQRHLDGRGYLGLGKSGCKKAQDLGHFIKSSLGGECGRLRNRIVTCGSICSGADYLRHVLQATSEYLDCGLQFRWLFSCDNNPTCRTWMKRSSDSGLAFPAQRCAGNSVMS